MKDKEEFGENVFESGELNFTKNMSKRSSEKL